MPQLRTTLAAALAIAAATAPTASARPFDLSAPETRIGATQPHGLRSPDTRDLSIGRSYESVSQPAPVPQEDTPASGEDNPWPLIALAVAGAGLGAVGLTRARSVACSKHATR